MKTVTLSVEELREAIEAGMHNGRQPGSPFACVEDAILAAVIEQSLKAGTFA